MKLEEKLNDVFEDGNKMQAYYNYLRENLPEFMHKKDIDAILELYEEARQYNIINMEAIAQIIDDSIGYQPIIQKGLMRNLKIDDILND